MKRTPLLIVLFSAFCTICLAQTPGVYVGTERVDYLHRITKKLPAKNSKELISITTLNDSTLNLMLSRDYMIRGRKMSETKVIPVRVQKGGDFEEIGAGMDASIDGRFTSDGLVLNGYDRKKRPLYKTTFVRQ